MEVVTDSSRQLKRSPARKQDRSEALAQRLHAPMTALGIIFLLVVIAQAFVDEHGALAIVFEVLAWLLWAVFVAEFVARVVIAPSPARFLRRNWWQTIFLIVPFFRFLSLLWAVRVARAGRIVGSAIRTGRSAMSSLRSRLWWLTATTTIVLLAGSQILFEFSDYSSYALALHDTALTIVSGEPLSGGGAVARVLEIILALYSVVVFAAIAGSLGAYFLERKREQEDAPLPPRRYGTSL